MGTHITQTREGVEGEVVRASELGHTRKDGKDTLYTWAICPECGKARWTQYCIARQEPSRKTRCFKCGHKKAHETRRYKPVSYTHLTLPTTPYV